MSSELLKLRKATSSKLKRGAFENYRRFLAQLLQDYSHEPLLDPLRRCFDAEDWDGVLNEADSLSSLKLDDATKHYVANQFAALIRKYPWPTGTVHTDPERTAILNFAKAEHKCRRINAKMWAWRRRVTKVRPYHEELAKMRSFITYVLGEEPNVSRILDSCGFGPGASIGVHGDATNAARKLGASRWTVTPAAQYYAYEAIMRHAQCREVLLPEHRGFTTGQGYDADSTAFKARIALVDNNKITFVPKTAKTKRSIAVEPLLNGFVQKGIDTDMRMLLKRVGIDLSDQSRNSELAREGTSDDELSYVTIDLSAASDSVATEVVRELIPSAWFELLCATRSPSYSLYGVTKNFHKFCSMGNGFCFPLESLIFAAACHATGTATKDLAVYGDDIIVRKPYSRSLITLLGWLGFAVNKEKTFLEGPFRESCGKDWFEGKDVRPYILDGAFDSLEALYKYLNLTAENEKWSYFFSGVRGFIISLIPKPLRLFRPYRGQPDTGIDSTGDEHLTCPSCKYLTRESRWIWTELCHKPIADKAWVNFEGTNAILLYGALSGSNSKMPFTFRRKTRTKVRRTSHPGATSQWLPGPAGAIPVRAGNLTS